MEKNTVPFETLKQILRHVQEPEQLDDHPWTRSLIVQEAVASNGHLSQCSPGQQLIGAIGCLFPQLQPSAPPRRGKRLDPRWGEFRLLAALYFAPLDHGSAFPTTLMDAWGRIDPAILYFVYGKPAECLEGKEIERYQLVGEDLDYAAASTLSDWHRKGLEQLTDVILNRERFLARSATQPSIILEPGTAAASKPETPARGRSPVLRRAVWLALLMAAILALGLASLKARRIYVRGQVVYQDLTRLQELARGPVEIKTLDGALPLLRSLREDLSAFKEEIRPVLPLSSRLGWVPAYGQDLASAPDLMELGERLLNAAILSGQAAQPLLHEIDSASSRLEPARLTALLIEAQPGLQLAREELDGALASRKAIRAEGVSARLRTLLVDQIDPILRLADEGLSLGMAAPNLLGAGAAGPRMYLLLPQNEDELRPTGGFITSAGNLVVHNGEVISLGFESLDDDQVDWSKPYPFAPWQLQEYMDSRILLLRDSNWFTDFPTTVRWAETLYAYSHSHSVDGVIAFDQRFLVMLLGEIGPLDVEGAPYPITQENVIQYMRQSKIPPPGATENWYRKEFIGKLAKAILAEFSGGQPHDWKGLASFLSRALEERHLLLQFDDPTFTKLLAERGWDNALRPGEGDYLMVVDTNVGFNKTNAVVAAGLAYDVDLHDLSSPESTLVVSHKNNARKDIPCVPGVSGQIRIEGEEWYAINRCYWNYLRVYKQAGVKLIKATPQAILGGWTLAGESIPARVDVLDEDIPGAQTFGTLQVVHGGQSLSASFTFALPPSALTVQSSSGERSYRLKIQKQPGTIAIPVTVRIHLPPRAVLKSISLPAILQGQDILVATDLRTDVEFELVFRLQ